MSDINSISQYYNLYDSSKGYTELLFRAGKVLQSKEVNELQSTIKNQIKNVGDTILTDGDIVEGCQLVIDDKKATLTKGKIYLDGNVRDVSDTELTITGEGTEIIGVILKKEVVTPDDDPDLLEVASGYDNYNQDGAYRLKEFVEITLNDPNSTIIYTLEDGQQIALNTSEDLTQMDKIQATLARRTFDESGNYKVNGMKLVEKNQTDIDHIYISMEPGKAYVRGYEVVKPAAQTIPLDRATDLRTVENEPKQFKTGTDLYALNNDYINAINKVVAIVEVTRTITRSSIVGGTDSLPLTPVASISEVRQGGTVYNSGVDYQLTNDGVDWSLGGSAPDPGSTYSVTWSYNKTMIVNTDYVLYNPEDRNTGYIKFLDGDKPINNSTFLVNYNFMLCRRDMISIDKDGKVVVTKGQSDILKMVESPSVDADVVLPLGSVLLKPKTDEVAIINNNTQTIPMLDLYKMLNRISSLEYNQAITDLDNEAAAGENATELIGVLTDGFIGLTKSDIYHSEWSASIDLDNEELTLPFETNVQSLTINTNDSFNVGVFNRTMTAPYTEVKLLSQNLATNNLRINSYNAFPKTPVVTLSPSVDNWVDTKTTIGGTITKTVTLRRWWYHKSASWAAEEKALWKSYGFADGGKSLGMKESGTSTKEVTKTVSDTAILYMRQKTVKVAISNLSPNVDNITATFDGKPIKLQPTSSAYRGTNSGTLKADSKGKTSGHFTIPARTLCGTRKLTIYPASTPSLTGTADYTANGRKVTKSVYEEKITVRTSDPLAQSFQFNDDRIITGVGVYFKDKDSVEPVTVQVRNMVNGYPGTTVYAEKVIDSEDIKASSKAQQETRVKFDDPVYCNGGEQYCFTILSNSNIDSVWIAETSKTDVNTKVRISKNPYLNGALFSSSNAVTWTAHQSSDLKFNLYGAKFGKIGSAVFNSVTDVEFDRLLITSDESIPSGCSVSWQYSVNDGDWMPIETYDDRELDDVARKVKVRVLLTAGTYTSPAISMDGLMLAGFKNTSESVYVSKNVYVNDGYNKVKQVVDLHLPPNTSVTMWYSTDADGNEWHATSSVSQVQKSHDFTTYTFEDQLDSEAYNYRCKVVLKSSSPISRPRAKNLRSIMKQI